MKPILVIPVYKGGIFFDECLNSLSGKENCFEEIFISFNGTNDDVREDISTFKKSKIDKNNVTLLKSYKTLSSVEHGTFILNAIEKNGFSDNTYMMTLFHDDVLINVPKFAELNHDEIIFGNWKILGLNRNECAFNGPDVNPKIWLRRFGFYQIFTNGSGTVARLKIFKDVNNFMRQYDSGVRFEYLLVTHRQINKIIKFENPLVEIRVHPGQDGANIPMRAFIQGEIGFIKWLIKQGRIKSLRDYMVVSFLAMSIASGFLRRTLGQFSSKSKN